jgi:hypothetical protein
VACHPSPGWTTWLDITARLPRSSHAGGALKARRRTRYKEPRRRERPVVSTSPGGFEHVAKGDTVIRIARVSNDSYRGVTSCCGALRELTSAAQHSPVDPTPSTWRHFRWGSHPAVLERFARSILD